MNGNIKPKKNILSKTVGANKVSEKMHTRAIRNIKSNIRSKASDYAKNIRAKIGKRKNPLVGHETIFSRPEKEGCIRTPIDDIFCYIEDHSPIKESMIPHSIRKFKEFEEYVNLLESKGLIEIQFHLFEKERTFIFKTRELQRYLCGVRTI
jgi:hypothetical protein